MKSLKQHIKESFKIGKNKMVKYNYSFFPKSKRELQEIIKEHFAHDNYNLNDIDTSKITDMSELFARSQHHLTGANILGNRKQSITIKIDKWNTDNVSTMESMFSGCYGLGEVNIGSWNVSNVGNSMNMLENCYNLKSIGDLSSWRMNSCKNAAGMFKGCEKLETIGDISNLFTNTRIYDMTGMFYNCFKIEDIGDISNWNVKLLKYSSYMFYNCDCLSGIGDLENWGKYKFTHYYMFADSGILPPSWA